MAAIAFWKMFLVAESDLIYTKEENIFSLFLPKAYFFVKAINVRTGLLTRGSSCKPRLPICRKQTVAFVRHLSPLTATGSFPIFTGFPIKL
jgi:hypothetical protein